MPPDAPKLGRLTVTCCAPRGYTVTKAWPYRDSEGRLLGWSVRYDRFAEGEADKQFRPFTFCQGPGGQREWRCKAFPQPRPLYGLDAIAARPGAPVIVVEGEKKVGPAITRFPDYVAVTSPGGAGAARLADWSSLAGRDVTIWPDADRNGAGARYAEDVADMLRNAGAASVRIVKVPNTFPDGWDLADTPPDGVSDADLARMLAEAEGVQSHSPIPLFPPLPAPEPYPVDALGPVLSQAAAAIARKVQAPVAIAAQSVLGATSLAAQSHADVLLPFGQARPLSLYLVTVAASGDRKSTADNEALWPIRRHEKRLREIHDEEMKTYRIEAATWNAEKKKIECKGSIGRVERRQLLTDLGPEPEHPLKPYLTVSNLTVEGLLKTWMRAPASLGMFTAEGGQFTGGHGMSEERRLETAGIYSELWDGRPVKRIRALDGDTVLNGRRLCIHVLVQQDAAARFLADPTLRDQGLLSRVLVAAPESIAGTRFYKDTAPQDDAAIKAYGAQLLSILEARWPLEEGKAKELKPRVLTISAEAEEVWREFHDHVEGQCGPGNDLAPIQDFAAKAAEHAARIAGVLTIVEDPRATEIGRGAMESALTLADRYVNEALRLQRAVRTDPRLLQAQQLLDWMRVKHAQEISFRDILQFRPGVVRTKAAAEEALTILSSHGWVVETSHQPRRFRLVTEG